MGAFPVEYRESVEWRPQQESWVVSSSWQVEGRQYALQQVCGTPRGADPADVPSDDEVHVRRDIAWMAFRHRNSAHE